MTSDAPPGAITAVLTVWKRQSLARQLAALRRQTRPPAAIWIYHCGTHVDPEPTIRGIDWAEVNYFRSEHDLSFFGRFALAAMVETPFATVIDDDMIPGVGWFELALAKQAQHNAVVCGQGCILPRRSPDPRNGVYPASLGRVRQDTPVDFGCCSWFFPSPWARAMWTIPPIHLRNAEDMHFAAAMERRGIQTMVPAQEPPRTTANLAPEMGHDQHAAYLDHDRYAVERNITLNHLRAVGWKLLLGGEQPAARS